MIKQKLESEKAKQGPHPSVRNGPIKPVSNCKQPTRVVAGVETVDLTGFAFASSCVPSCATLDWTATNTQPDLLLRRAFAGNDPSHSELWVVVVVLNFDLVSSLDLAWATPSLMPWLLTSRVGARWLSLLCALRSKAAPA